MRNWLSVNQDGFHSVRELMVAWDAPITQEVSSPCAPTRYEVLYIECFALERKGESSSLFFFFSFSKRSGPWPSIMHYIIALYSSLIASLALDFSF